MEESHISVYLVDDHPLVIEGVKKLLSHDERIVVVAHASSGPEALRQLRYHPEVRVAIVDMNMPEMSGIELTQALRRQYPNVRVLILSMDYEYDGVKELLAAGGSGYLLKNTSREEITTAVREIATGHTFFSPAVGATLLQQFAPPLPAEPVAALTTRELEVLRLIALEYTNGEIADQLCISERTVETHRKNLMAKTHSKTVVGLIQYALRHKLLP